MPPRGQAPRFKSHINRGVMSEAPITVVMITRNRGRHIHTALEHLVALPERPHIIVVDNGSSDDTVNIARSFHRSVEVVPLGRNMGGAGRNVGVALASTPYVAFSDDDSWWAAGSLDRACNLFESHPRLGLVEARILVGPHQRIDPVCQLMAESPLASHHQDGSRPPGITITSFIACGAIVRRAAFRQVGGFHPRFGVGGEEEVLALDLLRNGWQLVYDEELTAYHYPSPIRNLARRQRHQVRNALWTAWLRRPASSALATTWRIVSTSLSDDTRRVGLFDALLGLPWILPARHPIPPSIDRQVQVTEASFYGSLGARS
jgi:GT2 family glycosyltransferase